MPRHAPSLGLDDLPEITGTVEPAGGEGSRRQILRTTSIIGGASAITIVLSLVRTKFAALALGPSGIGLLGLINNLMNATALVAALGIGTSGVRFISDAAGRDDGEAVARARRALVIATAILAILGASLTWLLKRPIAAGVLGDPNLSPMVGWTALGVALLVAAGAQGALLNGLRRTGDMARVQIGGALASTIIGVPLILLWGEEALMAYILAAPLALYAFGQWYVSRIAIPSVSLSFGEFADDFVRLGRLGLSIMLAALVLAGGLLLIRMRVRAVLGPEALGLFEAAWMIATTYLGAVMGAMGTDYYPRLTALGGDRKAAAALVNEQTRIAVWLCGPVCVGFIGLAPWIFSLLFSDKFAASAEILRWQLLGDVLRIFSWPIGFLVLALGEGRRYLVTESLSVGIFTATIWFGLPYLGLPVTGFAFILMYLVYLPIVYVWANRRIGFRWDAGVKRDGLVLAALAITTAIASQQSPVVGAVIGVVSGAGLAGAAVWQLRDFVGRDGLLGKLARVSVLRRGRSA